MFFDRVSWCSRREQFSGSDRKPGSSPQRRVPDLDICAIEADSGIPGQWQSVPYGGESCLALNVSLAAAHSNPEIPADPPGSKNKVTQTLEQLAERQAEQVFQKVTEQALAGDVSRQKIFLDRVYLPAKDRPINCDIRVIAPFSTSVGEHQAQTERAGKTRER